MTVQEAGQLRGASGSGRPAVTFFRFFVFLFFSLVQYRGY